MRANRRLAVLLAGILVSQLPLAVTAQTTLTEGTNLSADISPVDGRIAFDLLGGIWLVDSAGGMAQELPNAVRPARAPRWSPSGHQIIYEASYSGGKQLWLQDADGNPPVRITTPGESEQQAAWHPDGDRLVYAASGKNNRLDLWEVDLPTGLRWRLTDTPADEMEPAWSANGRHLAYVQRDADAWSLVLRRRGTPDTVLLQSPTPIRAPSWRPDGSLITFYAHNDGAWSLQMVILSDPPLVRDYSRAERDPFLAPVSWRDRNQMVYTADGKILSREFDDWRAVPVRFRAAIGKPAERNTRASVDRELPVVTPARDTLVIRAARLFDGITSGYREGVDVVVEGARIASVGPRSDHGDLTILDLGDVTILPGFIDAYSAMPTGNEASAGASMLAYGVTTFVSGDVAERLDANLWHGERTPGPRLIPANTLAKQHLSANLYLATLPASTPLDDRPRKLVRDFQNRGVPVLAENWTVGLGLGVDLLLGADTLPSSPGGLQYQDMRAVVGAGPVTLVSGLADAGTPGISQLLASRQAQVLGHTSTSVRRLSSPPRLDHNSSGLVVGSRPNGLPPGLAMHAELRALAAAGLSGEQVLKAASANAAKVLGLKQQIGTIVPGAMADLVLVAGDPLKNVSDTLQIVAVIRNGRFYSLISLLERATAAADVE